MELRLRKRINNRLPGYKWGTNGWEPDDYNHSYSGPYSPEVYDSGNVPDQYVQDKRYDKPKASSAAGIGPWFALGEWVGSGIAEGISNIKSAEQLRQDAGTSYSTVNGISYQKENEIDKGKVMRNYNREMGTSFLTNPFKGLTMLFGRRKQQKKLDQARLEQNNVNNFNRSSAVSSYLQSEYANQYGNPQDQILYAKSGKDAVNTSVGEINTIPNSKTEGGEIIYNKQNGTAHIVPGNANGDNHLSFVKPSDAIITNKFGIADSVRPAAKALEQVNKNVKNRGYLSKQTDDLMRKQATAVLDQAAQKQKYLRDLGILPNPENKKYALGKIPSAWYVDALGSLTGLGQMISAAVQKPKRSNTYMDNPLERYALNRLSSLRIDQYPIMKDIYDQYSRNKYSIDRSGGLSGSQKDLARIATGIATQNAIAAANADIQKQNNVYSSNAASSMLQAGQATRAARMNANQYDLDYYSKSHAAKLGGIQMGLYNLINAGQQLYSNEFKRRQFNLMYPLYAQEIQNDKNKIQR